MMIEKSNLGERLGKRIKLNVEEYEKILFSGEHLAWDHPSAGRFKFEGVQNAKRVYS